MPSQFDELGVLLDGETPKATLEIPLGANLPPLFLRIDAFSLKTPDGDYVKIIVGGQSPGDFSGVGIARTRGMAVAFALENLARAHKKWDRIVRSK